MQPRSVAYEETQSNPVSDFRDFCVFFVSKGNPVLTFFFFSFFFVLYSKGFLLHHSVELQRLKQPLERENLFYFQFDTSVCILNTFLFTILMINDFLRLYLLERNIQQALYLIIYHNHYNFTAAYVIANKYQWFA